MSVSKRVLFTVWHMEPDASKKLLAVQSYIYNNIIDKSKFEDSQCANIDTKIKNFIKKMTVKWKENHRIYKNFVVSNQEWLDDDLILADLSANVGRPELNFQDSQEKTKKKKLSDIVKGIPCDKLVSAASTSLYNCGKRSASKMISLLSSDESLPKRIISVIQSDDNQPNKYTPEEALALYIDGGYTKKSYMDLQRGTRKRNANIFPTYDVLRSAKKLCYPSGLIVTDHSFEVPLQNLIDHTVSRIYEAHLSDLSDFTSSDTD